jgi:transposase-like protein
MTELTDLAPAARGSRGDDDDGRSASLKPQRCAYDPALAAMVQRFMSRGLSLSAAAQKVGVHRQRLYDWARQHPEFGDALDIARGMQLFHWESVALSPEVTAVQAKIALRILGRLNPEDWGKQPLKSKEPTVTTAELRATHYHVVREFSRRTATTQRLSPLARVRGRRSLAASKSERT